ncbi:MAG TPA: DNA translocase FtsK 4TM domain-containing protein [Stellaceae bacterium]
MAIFTGSIRGNAGRARPATTAAAAKQTRSAADGGGFWRRRLREGAGLLLVATTLLLIAALASYDSHDPSLNVAIDAPVHNVLGHAGAGLADMLFQLIGLSAWLLPLVLSAWAFRLLAGRAIPALWLRLLALLPTLLLGSFALALLPRLWFWRLDRVGPGGWCGDILWEFGRGAGLSGLLPLASVGAAALVGLLLLFIFGLSWGDWREIGHGAGKVAAVSGRGTAAVAGYSAAAGARFGRWARDRSGELLQARRDRSEPVLGGGSGGTVRPSGTAGGGRVEPSLSGAAKAAAARAVAVDDAAAAARRAAAPADIVAPAARLGTPLQKRADSAGRQAMLDLDPVSDHVLPPLDLLAAPPLGKAAAGSSVNEEALQQNARLLESVLDDFGVRGQIVKVRPGPVVTLYELEPAPGIKASRIIGLADDIARSMSAVSVRVAVVPGRNVIGIELPNAKAETVYLRELLSSDAYEKTSARLSLVLGKDIGGSPVVADLAKMPHLLIAGTTGSGKSVGINTMILSVLYRMPPDQCKFIMVDPKMLELSIYDGIPHLLTPVVTDPKKAVVALKWTVREMETRYRNMSKLGVRNIEGYNARLAEARAKGEELKRKIQTGFDPETGQPIVEEQPLDMSPLPFIVVVVDEMADLMLVAGKEIEAAIQRLAQMARAAGIHIIMATQRPSVDVITGTIKANFPTRISFQVTSKIDSRTILGEGGAEQLLGRGDMLYMAGGGRLTRVHGPFVADQEVESVVNFLKSRGEPTYLDEITEDDESGSGGGFGAGGDDEGGSGDTLYDQAVALVCRERKCSTSFIQRHLQIGYNRAARIVERMEQEGVISAANHVGKREVLARDVG